MTSRHTCDAPAPNSQLHSADSVIRDIVDAFADCNLDGSRLYNGQRSRDASKNLSLNSASMYSRPNNSRINSGRDNSRPRNDHCYDSAANDANYGMFPHAPTGPRAMSSPAHSRSTFVDGYNSGRSSRTSHSQVTSARNAPTYSPSVPEANAINGASFTNTAYSNYPAPRVIPNDDHSSTRAVIDAMNDNFRSMSDLVRKLDHDNEQMKEMFKEWKELQEAIAHANEAHFDTLFMRYSRVVDAFDKFEMTMAGAAELSDDATSTVQVLMVMNKTLGILVRRARDDNELPSGLTKDEMLQLRKDLAMAKDDFIAAIEAVFGADENLKADLNAERGVLNQVMDKRRKDFDARRAKDAELKDAEATKVLTEKMHDSKRTPKVAKHGGEKDQPNSSDRPVKKSRIALKDGKEASMESALVDHGSDGVKKAVAGPSEKRGVKVVKRRLVSDEEEIDMKEFNRERDEEISH